MTCTYGQEHSLANEPTSITHRTPPPIRKGENRKKITMSGAITSIYLHWEEREFTLEELTVLTKLNLFPTYVHSQPHSGFIFFILKANLVLVKDARLTSRIHCSLRRLLPRRAPLLEELPPQLPAATWCRQTISRARTELADPALWYYQRVSPPGMCSPE